MSAKVSAKNISFDVVQANDQTIVFQKESAGLGAKDVLEVSVYLCDDAKTFCIRKQITTTLKAAKSAQVMMSAPIAIPASAAEAGMAGEPEPSIASSSEGSLKTKKIKPKKDLHGFWDNAEAQAIEEAAKSGKLLMIDFYGIWCPPCNQFVESVFPTAEFKKEAKKFVLLKMDADQETSWRLKSLFKVGGYPTIVFAKVEKGGSAPVSNKETSLKEIDRVIGFFPSYDFIEKMQSAQSHKDLTLSDRLLIAKGNYLELLESQLKVKQEQKDKREALRLAEEGLKIDPENSYFKVIRISLNASNDPKVLELKEAQATLKLIIDKNKGESVDTLLALQELIVGNPEHFHKEMLVSCGDVIQELLNRVNLKTLNVDGYELSIADLYAFQIDLAQAMKDTALEKKARTNAIDSYRKLITLYGKKDSRGLNLELAYLLRKDGQVEAAKEIYERFIKLYPSEFTFYYAASKHYLDLKDYPRARELANHAIDFSYGDNQIRSVEQLVKVMIAQGHREDAKKIGAEFIAHLKDPSGYEVRTQRYIDSLKKTIEESKI